MVSVWWVVVAVLLGFSAGFFVFALMSTVAGDPADGRSADAPATDASS